MIFSIYYPLKILDFVNEPHVSEDIGNRIEDEHDSFSESDVDFFRDYSREKALEIWKDHPMLGVGPGMFGGIISIRTNSSIYSEYNFIEGGAHNLLIEWSGIDQYWPQVLAEIGVVGMMQFVVFFIFLSFILFSESERASVHEVKKFLWVF